MERVASTAKFDGCGTNISSRSIYLVNSKKIIIPIFIDGETGSERLKDSPKVTQPRCGTGERRTQGGRLPNIRSFSSEHLTHHRHTSRAQDSFLPGAGSVLPSPGEAVLSKGGLHTASCSSLSPTAQDLPL